MDFKGGKLARGQVDKEYESIEYGVLSIGRGNNPAQRGAEDRRIGGGRIFRSRVSAVGSLVQVFRFGYRFRT
jgi:hypothetical protein